MTRRQFIAWLGAIGATEIAGNNEASARQNIDVASIQQTLGRTAEASHTRTMIENALLTIGEAVLHNKLNKLGYKIGNANADVIGQLFREDPLEQRQEPLL